MDRRSVIHFQFLLFAKYGLPTKRFEKIMTPLSVGLTINDVSANFGRFKNKIVQFKSARHKFLE